MGLLKSHTLAASTSILLCVALHAISIFDIAHKILVSTINVIHVSMYFKLRLKKTSILSNSSFI